MRRASFTQVALTSAAGVALMACSGGASSPPAPPRTVTGTLQTVYQAEDGTRTTAGEFWPLSVTALLVPDASPGGYTSFPIAMGDDGHFSVSGVPAGRYFLQIDEQRWVLPSNGDSLVPVVVRTLHELTTSTPDLSTWVVGRPDLAFPTAPTPVAVQLTNLAPWRSTSQLCVTSAGASLEARAYLGSALPDDSTSVDANVDWGHLLGLPGLPDGSKGDLVHVQQRVLETLPSGASLRTVARHATLGDVTIVDGGSATLAATLVETPRTGSLRAIVLASQFAALAPQVSPDATPYWFGLSVGAAHRPVTGAAIDSRLEGPILLALDLTGPGPDVDLGTLTYGQFLGDAWRETYKFRFVWDVPLTVPAEFVSAPQYVAKGPLDAAPATFAPELGPPTAPRLDGADAFQVRSGVKEQPTITWSAPALGSPTHYVVELTASGPFQADDVASLRAVVWSGQSFQVPAGFLRAGTAYSGRITAVRSPAGLDDPVFAEPLPVVSAELFFGYFRR